MAELSRRLKAAESANADLSRRNDELTSDLANANGENARLQAELARLRQHASDLQDRCDALGRENKQLSGKFLPFIGRFMPSAPWDGTWFQTQKLD